MAFGSSMKKESQQTQTDGEQKRDWYWLDLHSGVRVFRILPEVDQNGNLVLDANQQTQPESEVSWYECWWNVMAGGNEVKRRIFLANRFKNPLWEYIKENFEKGSPEWKLIKQKFGVNVFDRTSVLRNDEDVTVYPNEKGEFIVLQTGKLAQTALKGDPQPHNKVLILEGSAGDIGGKHLLNQLFELTGNIENPTTGNVATLSEVDLRIKTTGQGIKTVRNIFPSANFKPLDESIVRLPRWDIASWATPWPDQAVIDLINGIDFNEVVEEYNIQLFPKLQVKEVVEDTFESSAGKKTQKLKSAKKPEPKLNNDDALFDD